MPLPLAGLLAVGAGLGVAGNIAGGFGRRAAAKESAAAARRGQDMQMQMFREGQQATLPYRQAGERALGQYEDLLTPEAQGQFFQQYQTSPIFQAMRDQAIEANLRGASATGGLRSGEADMALQSIAPQLAMGAINQRLQGLQSLYGTGAGAAGQTAGLAPQVGGNVAGMMMQEGQFKGQAANAMPAAIGQSLGQLGGLAMYAGQGGFEPAPGGGQLA